MSYPPPPGTVKSNLPPKPPTSIHAFASFKPRQVGASSIATISAPPSTHASYASPATSYGGYGGFGGGVGGGGVAQFSQPATQYSQPATQYTQTSTPPVSYGAYGNTSQSNQSQSSSQIQSHTHPERRQFVPRQNNNNNSNNNNNNNSYPPLDPELEAQIAEQQSIYDPAKRAQAAANAQVTTTSANYDSSASFLPDGSSSLTNSAPVTAPGGKKATVLRSGGGETWKDDSLLEWDPAHFRLFVGNLAGEVTDESLLKAFAAYTSVQRARVIRDKRTTKSRGYGFVAFQDGDEYFKAAREMQGKYIGSHPVLLRKSTTEIRPVVNGRRGKNGKLNQKNGNNGGKGALGKKSEGGIKKKDKGPKLLG